ncbi:LOW QUALITY PROTEIN: hypothetical protein PHMEG_00025390 [Phytophthora megakarya]|uniref:Uncharacterized protein n=1 Tax=Phytophthora megakarya TaxID=4795 RepID=A0A225VCA0_9STRA|nr:LOW QUALITY PROTEIN: hypothetical protein PHMEG_00025390 [Phytophthora megakarya]
MHTSAVWWLSKAHLFLQPPQPNPISKCSARCCYASKDCKDEEFDVISLNNSIQFDAYSCGVYVCWMFIRQVAPGPPLDMSANALTQRRFELFYYLLTGHFIPFEASQVVEDDVTEEKMPVQQKTPHARNRMKTASAR